MLIFWHFYISRSPFSSCSCILHPGRLILKNKSKIWTSSSCQLLLAIRTEWRGLCFSTFLYSVLFECWPFGAIYTLLYVCFYVSVVILYNTFLVRFCLNIISNFFFSFLLFCIFSLSLVLFVWFSNSLFWCILLY